MKILFFDLHGVLVDFVGGLETWSRRNLPHGEFDLCKTLGISHEELWTQLNNSDFWRELPLLPEGVRMMRMVRQVCADCGIPTYVLTRPMARSPLAIPGTIDLAVEQLGFKFEQIIIASAKIFCSPNNFLIDDEYPNVHAWRSNYGLAFQWPSRFNGYTTYGHTSGAAPWEFARADLITEIMNWITN